MYQLSRKTVWQFFVFNFLGILAGRCGRVVVRLRHKDTKGSGSRSGFDPAL